MPPQRAGRAEEDKGPPDARLWRPETLRLWLLGGFRVSVGTRTVEDGAWRLRKAASLVKLLALAPSHHLHRERAMDLLWPEHGRRAAANNLSQALHAARHALEPDDAQAASGYLASQGEQLVLCPKGELWLDVEAFEEAAATARRSRDRAAYRAALNLYAGELLPKDPYEEWVEVPREGLRQLCLALLVELGSLHEERGEYGPGIEALRRVLDEEPTRQEAHIGLMRLYALGGRQAEALAQYARLEETLSRKLGAEPQASSRALMEEIATGRFPPPNRPLSPPKGEIFDPPRHNLPATRTSFVGRDREIVEVKRALSMTRLLTLTGAGGSGKTRLALEVARDLLGAYPDGVWLVELAGLSEGDLVPQAVAAALGVKERPGQPFPVTLGEFLRAKQTLLVVDNCEHLLEATAGLVDLLLDSCSRLRILATSREALDVMGEVRWTVPPLSVPEPQDTPSSEDPSSFEVLEGYESVRLFIERAQAAKGDFEVTNESAPAVAEICWKLDGLPLAIELAAARIKLLPPRAMLERLDSRLKLVTGGARNLPVRQRTLRGTIEWSYTLLEEGERVLFARLAVFSGGRTLEAIEAICDAKGVLAVDTLDGVSSLLDKSLLRQEEGLVDEPRFVMLETIHEFARERLEASGEAEETRRLHAEYFLALAEGAEPELSGPDQLACLERLEAEHDNLRAALTWSLEKEPETALRLAGMLAHFWEIRSDISEGSRWLEAALRQSGLPDMVTEAATRAKALSGAGTFAWHRGDYDKATALHGEALELYRQVGDDSGVAFSLMCLGAQHNQPGDYERAAPFFEEALALSRRIGDRRNIVVTLHSLADVERQRGNYERSKTLGMESMALAREMEDKWQLSRIVVWMGLLTVFSGDEHDLAEGFLKEALVLSRELGSWADGAYCLEGFAGLAGAKAQGGRAARLWGAAEALRKTIGAPLSSEGHLYFERSMVAARVQLGEAAWEAALAEGRAMKLEEAVEYALSEDDSSMIASRTPEQTSTTAPRPSALTRREREVAKLLARDLTNRQIAEELVLSERTVENHVSNILKKLKLSSRSEVAAWVEAQRS
jgi:predicted ATPase/DNA-binding SARP family transcriptional activator/DNA-binding CsgD family transcriptional regulator